MGTAVRPATTSPASWDAFNDVDAFVDEVLAELAAMEGTKPTDQNQSGAGWSNAAQGDPGDLVPVLLQWRAIGQLSTSHSARCSPCFPAGPGLV
jgi:hypothetical protein